MVKQTKHNYFNKLGEKISNPDTVHKPFWTAFKRLLNKKKYTNIPPLLEGNQFIPNFQEKCKVFNIYFSGQCKLHVNSSILPTLFRKTISKLKSKKAHGHDGISIAMLK